MKTSSNDTKNFVHEANLAEQLRASDGAQLPIKYVLMLTNECNLKCSFCMMKKIPPTEAMTLRDWLSIIDQLPSNARVIFMGGEPLYFPGFEEVFDAAAKRNLRTTLRTNGLLLNRHLLDKMIDYGNMSSIGASFDDIGNKGRDMSQEQWQQLVENFRYARQRIKQTGSKALLVVETLMLDENAHELFALHKFLHESFAPDGVNYFPLLGSPLQLSDLFLDFDALDSAFELSTYKKWNLIKEQLNAIMRYNRENGVRSYFQPKMFEMNEDHEVNNIDHLNENIFDPSQFCHCSAPWSDMRIYGDGTVTSCLSIRLGNVKEQTLTEINGGERMRRMRNIVKQGLTKHCQRCGYLYAKRFA